MSPLLATHPNMIHLIAKRSRLPCVENPYTDTPKWIKVGCGSLRSPLRMVPGSRWLVAAPPLSASPGERGDAAHQARMTRRGDDRADDRDERRGQHRNVDLGPTRGRPAW
jgi:hypothetical protein